MGGQDIFSGLKVAPQKTIGGMAVITFGPGSTSLCTIALLLALASMLPDVASCRGYALFKRDKERIVSLVNKLKADAGTDVRVSWDRKLENTAGLECECGMITHSSQTWGWAVVSRFQRHFQLYFGHEVGGLLGYTARTPGDPYENQMKDITAIVKGWYKKGGSETDQLVQSKRMGCAIFPTCYIGDSKLITVLTCVFAPKAVPKVPVPEPEVEGSGDVEGSGEVMMGDAPSTNFFSEFKKAKKVIEKSHENEVEDEGYMKTGIRILNKRL